MEAWEAVRWLHLLAMAFFVGGQIILAAAVVPAFRSAGGGTVTDRRTLQAVARRFGYGTLVALGVLIATGAAMATHYHLWGSGTLHVKLALVALVGVLIGWHMRRPQNHALEGLVFVVSLAIVWLGVALAH